MLSVIVTVCDVPMQDKLERIDVVIQRVLQRLYKLRRIVALATPSPATTSTSHPDETKPVDQR